MGGVEDRWPTMDVSNKDNPYAGGYFPNSVKPCIAKTERLLLAEYQ